MWIWESHHSFSNLLFLPYPIMQPYTKNYLVQVLKRCGYFSGTTWRGGAGKWARENARATYLNGWPLSHVMVGPTSVRERFPRCVASSFLKLLCLRTDQLSGVTSSVRCGSTLSWWRKRYWRNYFQAATRINRKPCQPTFFFFFSQNSFITEIS